MRGEIAALEGNEVALKSGECINCDEVIAASRW